MTSEIKTDLFTDWHNDLRNGWHYILRNDWHNDLRNSHIAQALKDWCDDKQIELVFIQKGKPSQNGYVERFNRTYREEVLDAYAFESLSQARMITQAWMWVYNNERPHGALGYLPPTVFLQKHGRLINFPTHQKDNTINYKNQITNVAS